MLLYHTTPILLLLLVLQTSTVIPDSEVILAVHILQNFAAKRYILQQKCLKKLIGSCLLATLWYNF